MNGSFVCAVDVGTTSARAGVFARDGRQLARAEHPILLNQPAVGHAEHDSEDIWSAACAALRAAIRNSGVDANRIEAICFDATCSLVVRAEEGSKLSVSADGDPRWDTICWFDHRAISEADRCTATRHEVLTYLGGVMSPEMQTPKMMWLKRQRPETWSRAQKLFDLSDFLTWRATGSLERSQCTLTCKWAYLPHHGGWSPEFFDAVGLGELITGHRLPASATAVGAAAGRVNAAAARELGVPEGCVVASGLIDAYAGMLGAIGAHGENGGDQHLALIAGTSSCVMSFSREPRFVPSIWGPYLGAALPGLWASEGGQSATGALLDHIIRMYRQDTEPDAKDHAEIIARIQKLRAEDPDFGRDIHILPDFNGNRSPLADPRARGAIHGLELDASFDGLCKLYWRGCVSIALGIRHILEHLHAHGQTIEYLHVTGGHVRNPLLMELYADATGLTVVETEAEDAVLLGGAMAAASAAGWSADLSAACKQMRRSERRRMPDPGRRAAYDRDFRVFLAMHRQQRELREMASQP